MKLPTATTALAILFASVPFAAAIAVPDVMAEPVLESRDTEVEYHICDC